MSAESKKKRGEAGISHAKSNAHRINGWPVDWQARRMGVYGVEGSPSSGATTMRGMVGGMLAEALGYKLYGNPGIYDRMLAHAETRTTAKVYQQ